MGNEIVAYNGFRSVNLMSVTEFYAGAERGKAIQFTIGRQWCCLDKSDVKDLIMKLEIALGD